MFGLIAGLKWYFLVRGRFNRADVAEVVSNPLWNIFSNALIFVKTGCSVGGWDGASYLESVDKPGGSAQ